MTTTTTNGYGWDRPADGPPKLGPGRHRVRVKTVSGTRKADGAEIARTDKAGNAMVLVVVEDAGGLPAFLNLALTGQMEYKFRRFVQSVLSPHDLADLATRGLRPIDFARPEIAGAMLVDKELTIECAGPDAKGFMNWDTMPASASTVQPPPMPVNDTDIPF